MIRLRASHSSKRSWLWQVLVLAVGISLVFLWPLVVNFSTHLTSHDDGLLIGWTINWVSSAILNGQTVFNAPFLFPFSNSLSFSQQFLSTGLINLPIYVTGFSIVQAENLHFILGSVFMFVSMAALAQHVTKSFPAAILSAIIFVFGPLHAEFIVHLHVYLLAGLPIAILSLLKLSTTPPNSVRATWGWWSMLWLAVLYQALNDPHTLY